MVQGFIGTLLDNHHRGKGITDSANLMQGDSEYHHLTLKRVIDLSLNRNLNDPPTALMSMYLTTDTLLTSTAQSLALLIRLIPDALMNGHHPENLIAHLPTILYVLEHCHNL